MKAIVFEKPGDALDIKIREWKDPKYNDDEVLIKVKSFGLNFADIMCRKGLYADAPPMPFICGYEVAGIVEAIGKNITSFTTGDKVLAMVEFGGYAEYAVAREAACFKLPDNMTFAQGASIPVNFLTAYHCLHGTGSFIPGDKVLIHAIAGGVGLSALQLAKLAGAEVFGTASSSSKLELAKKWGCDHLINYSTHSFEDEIKKLNSGSGVDIILDSIGGRNIKKGISILNTGGRIVCFGVSSLSERKLSKIPSMLPDLFPMFALNIIPLLLKSKGLYGVNMLHVARDKQQLVHNYMVEILKLFSEGKLKTIVTQELSWKEMGQAQLDMENRKTTGKVVLNID